jgi:hypothetical protein
METMMPAISEATDRISHWARVTISAARLGRGARAIWSTQDLAIPDSETLRRSCDEAEADLAERLKILFSCGF